MKCQRQKHCQLPQMWKFIRSREPSLFEFLSYDVPVYAGSVSSGHAFGNRYFPPRRPTNVEGEQLPAENQNTTSVLEFVACIVYFYHWLCVLHPSKPQNPVKLANSEIWSCGPVKNYRLWVIMKLNGCGMSPWFGHSTEGGSTLEWPITETCPARFPPFWPTHKNWTPSWTFQYTKVGERLSWMRLENSLDAAERQNPA